MVKMVGDFRLVVLLFGVVIGKCGGYWVMFVWL